MPSTSLYMGTVRCTESRDSRDSAPSAPISGSFPADSSNRKQSYYVGFIDSLVRWCGSPPCTREPIAIQIKQIWHTVNATMTVISVTIGIRNLGFY